MARSKCFPHVRFGPADLQRLLGLHETIVEIAQHAERLGYHPPDSRDFNSDVIDWSVAWEQTFWKGVKEGSWQEDEWIERTEDFALAKLGEVRNLCEKWPGPILRQTQAREAA